MESIKMIDTHAHYNSRSISNMAEEITKLINNKSVSKIINVGLDNKTSEESIRISNNNKKIYSTIGIHPLYDGNVKELEIIYNKFNNEKIVAVGETGIDTACDIPGIKKQILKFIQSILLANKLHLPLIIHSNTTKDSIIYANKLCLEILKDYPPKYGFVFHCFQPDLEIMDKIVKMGGYISVGSMITKSNEKKSLEVVKNIPVDRILIETDYPYMTDNPIETVPNTFRRICELKNETKETMMNKLNENAKTLFYKIK